MGFTQPTIRSDRLFESVGGSERHPTPPSHRCWVSPNLLFGAIALRLFHIYFGTDSHYLIIGQVSVFVKGKDQM
ncbi:hypothetical protein [Limnospira sp. PMC 1042.18]|uniref:hypothetical protein n=1 Tax=Limnospira sp. PMC 1042.18 TaxID=2981018 RepID=UPI0028E15C03|nr:hypothetical protein [Limnospira sp. PMC 1042.18]MDT9199226.1 hypothetical protein [Limnospira sp. PMC 1042.18]